MSVLPVTNSRDGPFFESRSNARIVFNGRDNPAREGWDEFEDLREADNGNYNNMNYYARSNHYVADDERSQFTAEKGDKKAGGYTAPTSSYAAPTRSYTARYETPKPVNKWSIITNEQNITNNERVPADEECREVPNNWSKDSEDIFNNDKSFDEPEPEPVPEVPLPFSYLQLQSQANDMFVHLDVTEGCVESKVDALITKNASYDSKVVQEPEIKVEEELENEPEEETASYTETTGEEIVLGPVENDVMKCERQVGSTYKKSLKVGFLPGQTLITSQPNFFSAKLRKAKKKTKVSSVNLTEVAPMITICEDEYGSVVLEPMFFEPSFKELVQYKPFYDQESIDGMVVNDMLDVFQETMPVTTYRPKIPVELEEIIEEEVSEDESVSVVEDNSVTQLSVADSSLGSSVGSSSSEGLSAIPENAEYIRQMDSAIDDLLFLDAAKKITHAANKVNRGFDIVGYGIVSTGRYFRNGVKSMKKKTKSFIKGLWNIQIIKPKPTLANVSGAATFSKRFRELNPKKRDLPLVITQVDDYSDCSMSASSNSYTQATPPRSRRNIGRYNRRNRAVTYGSLSDASTISTKFSATRTRRFGNARTFQNSYVQDQASSSAESCVSYSEYSIQSGSYASSQSDSQFDSQFDSQLDSDSWSTVYGE